MLGDPSDLLFQSNSPALLLQRQSKKGFIFANKSIISHFLTLLTFRLGKEKPIDNFVAGINKGPMENFGLISSIPTPGTYYFNNCIIAFLGFHLSLDATVRLFR